MKVAIYGYGNLGKGVELAVNYAQDMTLFGIFTKRDPSSIKPISQVNVYSASDIEKYKNDIDVLIICSGSAIDLPVISPKLAKDFNIVDSFDTHAKIPEHFASVDISATESNHIALISAGWDPGMFSINRLYSSAILPNGQDYTFWGKGVSQGHSDAIRKIDGVIDARQYTIPVKSSMDAVRRGENPILSVRDKHTRLCYVVVEDGADKDKIEQEIKTMPAYFADYDTTVNFITMDEMKRDHSTLPHGGCVIRTGTTGWNNENTHVVEYNLKLDSNPEFTGSVLVAFARAINKMYQRGITGCKTVFDIAPADLSALSPDEIRKKLL